MNIFPVPVEVGVRPFVAWTGVGAAMRAMLAMLAGSWPITGTETVAATALVTCARDGGRALYWAGGCVG